MQSCSLRTQVSAVDLANEVVWVVGGDVGLQRLSKKEKERKVSRSAEVWQTLGAKRNERTWVFVWGLVVM